VKKFKTVIDKVRTRENYNLRSTRVGVFFDLSSIFSTIVDNTKEKEDHYFLSEIFRIFPRWNKLKIMT
jgi:hypothetical protein